jgi:trehalose-phosphatase
MEIQLAKREREESCEQALVFKSKVAELVHDLRDNVCSHGGWVEEKIYHATFHWRDTHANFRPSVVHKAKEIIQKHGFQAIDSHFAVEARPPIGWDKGRGTLHILEKLHGVTWADHVKAFFIGDDETDEDAMRALNGLGITFRVGKPNIKTAASHMLPNPAAVKVFLEWALDHFVESKKKPGTAVETVQEIISRNEGIVKREMPR